jgi:hypothetical protein
VLKSCAHCAPHIAQALCTRALACNNSCAASIPLPRIPHEREAAIDLHKIVVRGSFGNYECHSGICPIREDLPIE